jgi:hypothetical protein
MEVKEAARKRYIAEPHRMRYHEEYRKACNSRQQAKLNETTGRIWMD